MTQDHGPVRWWSIAIFVLVLFTLYYGAIYLVPPATPLIAAAEYIGAALVSVVLVMAPYGWAALQVLGFRPVGRRFVLGGIVGTFALSYIVTLLGLQSDWVQEVVEIVQEPGQLPVSLLLIAGLGPLAEELVFRGLFYAWLEGRWRARVAFLASSLAFAAAHWEPASIALSLLPGLFFGGLRWRSNSLVPSLVAHVINNAAFVLAAKYLDI